MRLLLLTSTEPRHLHLIKRLQHHGFDLQAWAEAKGESFNENDFVGENQALLSQHTRALSSALDSYFPPIDLNTLPATLFPRGSFRDTSLVAKSKAFGPDVIVSYGSSIIGPALIASARFGVLGSHQGLAQYFRGSGSNFFAFIEGKAAFMGVGVHFVDEGIDTGPLISQTAPLPHSEETYYSYSARLVSDTIDLYLRILKDGLNTSFSEMASRAKPLPFQGRLSRRSDFTPSALQQFLLMQKQKPFSVWHSESLREHGPPALL